MTRSDTMAKGTKTGGRNFLPGNTFGKGQQPLPPEVHLAKQFTRAQLVEAITKYVVMSLTELKVKAKDESLPAIEHMILRIIMNSILKGDQTRLDFLLDRIQGKVKQVVENIGDPRPAAAQLDDLHRRLVALITIDQEPIKEAQGLLNGPT